MGKKIYLALVVMLAVLSISGRCYAGIERTTNTWAWPFTLNTPMSLTDSKYGTSDWSNIARQTLQDEVVLQVVDNVPITFQFNCTVNLKIECYNDQYSTTPYVYTPALTVAYNPGSGTTYQNSADFNFQGFYRIDVTVLSVSYNGQPSPTTGMVQLTTNINADRVYNFGQHNAFSTTAAVVNNTTAGQQVQLSWSPIPGAEEYDIEWTSIANGDPNYQVASALASNSTNTSLTSQAALLFKNNASRLTTSGQTYNLPVVTNDDYFIVRMRGVQYAPDGTRLLGDWSYTQSNGQFTAFTAWPVNAPGIGLTWHQPLFNWQYAASFAEEGKRKDVISYFDGTLRNRQTVTLNNTDNVPVVQENVYDMFGRPFASIMPAPVNAAAYLHYFSNLNLNSGGTPYSYTDVIGSGTTNCEISPATLNTSNGSSKYYSPQNDFLTNANFSTQKNRNNYIPDAQGYPISVTQYTPDNTGRIKVQGGVGATFQPGSGNPTRYYYGKPEQWELDQLFGNDAGYAEHYTKNMVKDPNGQISVSYANASGKVVATALAGPNPPTQDPLPSQTTQQQQTTQVLKPSQFVFDNSNLKISASTTYLVTVPGTITFTYDMQQLIYTFAHNSTNICSSCYYNLHIHVANSCGTLFDDNTETIGAQQIVSQSTSCPASPSFTKNFTITPTTTGPCNITFEYVFSKSVMQSYVDQFITLGQSNGSILTQWSFLQPYLDQIDFTGILSDCKTCLQILGTQDSFTGMMSAKLTALGVTLSAADQASYTTWVNNKYQTLLIMCQALDGSCNYADCDEVQNQMVTDVSPGGQYALFDANNMPLETATNVIDLNWRAVFPVLPATSPIYQQNAFTNSNGVQTSVNDASTTLPDLVKYWQPAWGLKFLQFHPEYCKLQFCMINGAAESWDERVKEKIIQASDIPSIPGATAGFAYSYTNPSWLMAADPYFSSIGAADATAFAADLANYSQNILNNPNTTAPVKNLTQYVDYVLYCSANCSGSDTQSNNCWSNTCSPTCRAYDQEWSQYKALYFQLKDVYYAKRRASTTCGNNCSVGRPYTLSTDTCASVNDFMISQTSQIDSAQAFSTDTTTAVTVTYLQSAVRHNTSVYLYYSGGTPPSGAPSMLTFTTGTSKQYFYVPKAFAISDIKVKAVNCTGTAPAPYVPTAPTTWNGSPIQTPALTNYSCYNDSVMPPLTDFYVSSVGSVYSGHTTSTTSEFIVKVKPNVAFCNRQNMQATVIVVPANGNWDEVVSFPVNIDASSWTGAAQVSISYQNIGAIQVLGTATACTLPLPANNGCDESLMYKTSRFDAESETSTYPPDVPTATALNNNLVNANVINSCTGNADRWMVQLAAGLTNYSSTQIANLRAALIKFCSDNGDATHPYGASTTTKPNATSPTNPDAPYTSFGDVIKGVLGIPVTSPFTSTLNPWLLDGPPRYDVPSQTTNSPISYSSAAICAIITNLTTAYNAWPSHTTQSFYQYLVATYGSAMTLTSDQLTILTNSCNAGCNYILASEIELPVFMQPGATGCIAPADYNSAKSKLLSQIPGLTSSDPNYPTILTNYMNQNFGFSLSYSQYEAYEANQTSILCNQPAFTPVAPDPYAPIESIMSVATANGLHDYLAYINAQKILYTNNYISTCSAAQADLNATAPKQNYHYTLYYYDQADNLVRTVPPEGVTLLDPSTFSYIDKARDMNASTYSYSYNGPKTASTEATAMTTLSSILQSTGNVSVEMWLYNGGASHYHWVVVTPDQKYLFQVGLSSTQLNVDIYPSSQPSSGTYQFNPASRNFQCTVNATPPLYPFSHIVIQATNLGGGTGTPQIYLNGNALTVTTSGAKPQFGFGVIAGSSSVTYPDSIQSLKHLRLYNHLLTTANITADANDQFFNAYDTGYAGWYRFNVPAAGAVTTVNSTTTDETSFYGLYPSHKLTTNYAYTSTNQVVQQNSPDGGSTSYWYDMLSRLSVSQNAKQLAANNYSYTTYDAVLGRITEVGQKNLTSANLGTPGYPSAAALSAFYTGGTNSQITDTYYDSNTSLPSGVGTGLVQNNLRKRVVASTYTDTQTGSVQNATYYNYDIDGNVSTLWQQVNGLYNATNNTGLKRIDYEYDLVSGKVNFVRYQDGYPDQFYYKYNYDADNRITEAWSGTIAMLDPNGRSVLLPGNQKLDAAYYYYLHGPLARMELGSVTGKVQGLDYAYTLQGWLKGVNGQNTGLSTDIGQDGMTGTYQTVGRDAYAYSLGYYSGDYSPIGGSSSNAFSINYAPASGDPTGQNLYNGNISNQVLSLAEFNSGTPVGYTYHYDQLNRLKNMRQHNGITSGFTTGSITQDYREDVTYDGNGNILTYLRNGATAAGNQSMDNLTYNYSRDVSNRLVNNQLQYIHDAVTTSTTDLANQTSTTNYKYDPIGNLIQDAQNNITNVDWSVYGKIQNIYEPGGNINYTYDASANRVSKTAASLTTYYVRDAQGNQLAVYDNAGGNINWREQDLYGSSRLGIWKPNLVIPPNSTYTLNYSYGMAGWKLYELTNHLGNIMTTITDRRIQTSTTPTYGPDIATAQDYYPFGMLMPARQYSSNTYRFGFNGKENDNEVKGTGNQQDYGMRIYDPRVGRFLSVDPLTMKYPFYTPYQFAGNKPIKFVDIDGEEEDDPDLDINNKEVEKEELSKALNTEDFKKENEDEENFWRRNAKRLPEIIKELNVRYKELQEDWLENTANALGNQTVDFGKEMREYAMRNGGGEFVLRNFKNIDKVSERPWFKYQEQINKVSGALEYEKNGVRFDGFNGDALLEAKGNYQWLFATGKAQRGDIYAKMETQLLRQVNAASGGKLEWHFAEQTTMNEFKSYLSQTNQGQELLKKTEMIYTKQTSY